MKGRLRTGFAVLGTLLLPLPLLGLCALMLMKTLQETSRVQEPVVIPMLHPVEREGTLTHGRECQNDSDCDPRLRCFFSMVLQSSYCTDSRCMTDKECPEGFSCQTYTADDERELLKACSRVGDRKEGEECEVLTVESDSGCERRLLCQGWCGRPCMPGSPATCPEGFFCHASRVHGTDCQAVACGPGQDCSARTYPWAPGEVWMQCSQTCELEGKPPCPEGTACAVHRCRPVCSPDGGAPCAERFECTSHPNQPAVCAPDVADQLPP